MKTIVSVIFCLITVMSFGQKTTSNKSNTKTNTSTTNKTTNTTTKPATTVVTKPTTSTTPVNTNVVGSFILNYEIKNVGEAPKAGTMFYAIDNNQVIISPSVSGIKDVNNLRMLIDNKEGEMTMLTTDAKNKKSGLLTKLPKPVINKSTTTKKPPVITKTATYKTILGYKCEKILVNIGDTVNIEAYVTTDIIIDMNNLISLANTSLRNKSPLSKLTYDVKGTMLESIITKNNGNVTKLTVTDIRKGKPDPLAFSTNGYNIMDARGLPMFNGQ